MEFIIEIILELLFEFGIIIILIGLIMLVLSIVKFRKMYLLKKEQK